MVDLFESFSPLSCWLLRERGESRTVFSSQRIGRRARLGKRRRSVVACSAFWTVEKL